MEHDMLKISVNSLKADPEDLALAVSGASINLEAEAQIMDKVNVAVQVQRMGEKVMIRGKVVARSILKCARCLNEFEMDLTNSIFLYALPKQQEKQPGTEAITAEADDASIIYYAGEEIDLLPEVRSALLLALPMKPLCQENCKGLCTQCGRRLADGPCSCQEEKRQNPFSVLKDYRQ
jgi:uncharacterized protein